MVNVTVYDWSTGTTGTGIVDPLGRRVVSWPISSPGSRPNLYTSVMRTDEVVKSDPRFRSAMARRGYMDLSQVRVVPSVKADYVLPQRDGQWVDRASVFDKEAWDFGASRGLDAVTLWVNLTRGTVDSLLDTAATAELAVRSPAAPPPREAPRMAHLPEVDGSAVRWGRWRFRAGVDNRRGLEL